MIKQSTSRKGPAVSIGTKRRVSTRSADVPPTVPDGGYGWVVVVAAFCVQTTLGGFLYSFGIYFVEFLKVFQEDRGKTAWIGSTLFGGFAFTAPFTSILMKVVDCRSVVIVGSALLAVALFCSTFCHSVTALIVVLGVFGGIGLGLLYLPTVTVVGYYFEKRRSLAIAICTSGTGIGGIVFPILMQELIKYYGWRGSLWILSGLFVQCLMFGALLRPLTKYDMKKYLKAWEQKKSTTAHVVHFTGTSKQFSEEENRQGGFRYINKGFVKDKSDKLCTSTEEPVVGFNTKGDVTCDQNGHTDTTHVDVDKKNTWVRSRISSLTEYADVWLLTNPVFLIYAISNVLGIAGFQVSATFMPDYATSIDISESKVSFLLSISGFLNTFSKIIMGWLCDRPSVDPIRMFSIILLLGGIMALSLPHMKMYGLLACYGAVHGLNLGAIGLLGSINLVDLLGMEKMPGGLGIIMLLSGMGNLLAVPLAGLLIDISGSYVMTFSVFGSCSMLSGLLCLPLRNFARCIFGVDDN